MGGDDTVGKGGGGVVGFELKDTSTGGIPGRREGVATQRISQLLCIDRMIFFVELVANLSIYLYYKS
jgi:hypothetical protein